MEFQIRQAAVEDLLEIMAVMKEASETIGVKEWFVADEEDYVKQVLQGKGFVTGAWEHSSGELAGFFMVFYPDQRENLGCYAGFSREELKKVVYMDSTAVRSRYRGNHLQKKMLKKAEEILDQLQEQSKNPIQYRMCTVHPENRYSLKNMMDEGYEIVAERELYGGLPRYILCKHCRL